MLRRLGAQLRMRIEPKNAHAIRDADQHDAALGQLGAVMDRDRGGASIEAAAVDPDQDGHALLGRLAPASRRSGTGSPRSRRSEAEPPIDCMHPGAYWSALRTPCHFGAGCGARQRRSPTGGAANGRPLYTVRLSSTTPSTRPPSTLTGARRRRSQPQHRTDDGRSESIHLHECLLPL